MNHLAKNIRFLRKSRKWSQEELAEKLEVKRSSIAAYESKNVRPRLDFILALSKLFNIHLSDLIERDIEETGGWKPLGKPIGDLGGQQDGITTTRPEFNIYDETSVHKFIERSHRIRKMLEGFKIFYRFKLEHMEQLSEDARRLSADMDNFLLLMDHLLAHNEAIINAISRKA